MFGTYSDVLGVCSGHVQDVFESFIEEVQDVSGNLPIKRSEYEFVASFYAA